MLIFSCCAFFLVMALVIVFVLLESFIVSILGILVG